MALGGQMKLYTKEETKTAARINIFGAIGVLVWLGVASVLLAGAKQESIGYTLALPAWIGLGLVAYIKFKAANRAQLDCTSPENITRFNVSALYHALFRK